MFAILFTELLGILGSSTLGTLRFRPGLKPETFTFFFSIHSLRSPSYDKSIAPSKGNFPVCCLVLPSAAQCCLVLRSAAQCCLVLPLSSSSTFFFSSGSSNLCLHLLPGLPATYTFPSVFYLRNKINSYIRLTWTIFGFKGVHIRVLLL